MEHERTHVKFFSFSTVLVPYVDWQGLDQSRKATQW